MIEVVKSGWPFSTPQEVPAPTTPTSPTPAPEQKSLPGHGAQRGQRRRILRSLLAGNVPGAWASDHLEESERNTGWTFCAVRAIGLSVAQARVKCKDKETRRRLRRPNPGQTGAQFKYQLAQQLSLTGNALVWTLRNGLGVPLELYCLPTGLTQPCGATAEFPYGYYRVQPLNSLGITAPDGWTTGNPWQALYLTGAEIDARAVQPIHWPHQLYLGEGLSPQSAAALALDVAQEVERSRFYSLQNRGLPGLILKIIGGLSEDDEQDLRDEIAARNSGPHNARLNMLLPDGIEKVPGDDPPAELDYSASYPQIRDSVLAAHGTPAAALGVQDSGTYAALYAALRGWTELTIAPLCVLIGDGLSQCCKKRVVLEAKHFNDPQLDEQKWQNSCTNGSIFVDEDRKRQGLPTVNEWRKSQGLPENDYGAQPCAAGGGGSAAAGDKGKDGEDKPAAAGRTGAKDPARQQMPKNRINGHSRNGVA